MDLKYKSNTDTYDTALDFTEAPHINMPILI